MSYLILFYFSITRRLHSINRRIAIMITNISSLSPLLSPIITIVLINQNNNVISFNIHKLINT